jgi:hypothetical protein
MGAKGATEQSHLRPGGAAAPRYPSDSKPLSVYAGAMPNDTDLRFALQVAGAELADTPPAPDSPLGMLRLFAAAHPGVTLTAGHVRQALDGTLPPRSRASWPTPPSTGTRT